MRSGPGGGSESYCELDQMNTTTERPGVCNLRVEAVLFFTEGVADEATASLFGSGIVVALLFNVSMGKHRNILYGSMYLADLVASLALGSAAGLAAILPAKNRWVVRVDVRDDGLVVVVGRRFGQRELIAPSTKSAFADTGLVRDASGHVKGPANESGLRIVGRALALLEQIIKCIHARLHHGRLEGLAATKAIVPDHGKVELERVFPQAGSEYVDELKDDGGDDGRGETIAIQTELLASELGAGLVGGVVGRFPGDISKKLHFTDLMCKCSLTNGTS